MKRYSRRTGVRVALAISALLTFGIAMDASALAIYGVTGDATLVRFDSDTPGFLDSEQSVTGIGAGEAIIGMDFRLADLKLYAATRTTGGVVRLYTLDAGTAAATLSSTLAADPADTSSPYASLGGTSFGMDFNPVEDRLRIVSNTGANLRVDTGTGLVTTDSSLNPGSPNVVGVAYTNAYAGATLTSLYDIDSAADILSAQNTPNNGTLTQVGALGADVGDTLGFDILVLGGSNIAYASLSSAGTTSLNTIALQSGAATLVGGIGGNPALVAIAIPIDLILRHGFE